jgi:hypothetical protein
MKEYADIQTQRSIGQIGLLVAVRYELFKGPLWAVSRIVAMSCSEIRGPRSVFLANQVLDPRI